MLCSYLPLLDLSLERFCILIKVLGGAKIKKKKEQVLELPCPFQIFNNNNI
jgi:hypothetical protein